MERALVVLETDERGRELLGEAGELAGGVDARLDILSLMGPEEFAEIQETLDAVAQEEGTSYDDNVVLDRIRQDAQEVAEAELADVDVNWRVVPGRVGEAESEANRILEAANDNDADHVFLTGKQRSPTGKAVFGDRAQSVLLNFDGPVTTLLD